MASFISRLLPLFFLSSLLITFDSTSADSLPIWELCTKDFNYTIKSTFQANLNSLLSSLSSTTPATGFSNDTKGEDPDKVYGLAQCRGDITADECRSCINNNTTQDIVQRCPSGKIAFVWYDLCFLRYSYQNFFTIPGTSNSYHLIHGQRSSEPNQLMGLIGKMMGSLTTRAAYASSGRMFATGEVNFLSSSKLYSLVQCPRDLLPDSCNGCLRTLMNDTQQYFVEEGIRVIGQNCYFRYELFPFYDVSGAGAAPPPTAPATQSTATTPPPPPFAVTPSPIEGNII